MRIDTNTRPRAHEASGLTNPSAAGQASREGAALLQGLAVCGHCGRRLRTHYRGRNARPGYHCAGKNIVEGRGHFCLNVGGGQIDAAVTDAFLTALQPAGTGSCTGARRANGSQAAAHLEQWRQEVEETAALKASLAERRFIRPSTPITRRWSRAWPGNCTSGVYLPARELGGHRQAEMIERRQQQAPRALTETERQSLLGPGPRCPARPESTFPHRQNQDRKELLRTLVEGVTIVLKPLGPREYHALLAIRWKSNDIANWKSLCRAPIRRRGEPMTKPSTSFAGWPSITPTASSPASSIARAAARRRAIASPPGMFRVCATIAASPAEKAPSDMPDGELASVEEAAEALDLESRPACARWIEDGFIPAEQPTPGAPWQIRVTADLLSRFIEETPPDLHTHDYEATKRLGVSRQTVVQRVACGELQAVHIRQGRRKGLRIKVPETPADLFTVPPGNRG